MHKNKRMNTYLIVKSPNKSNIGAVITREENAPASPKYYKFQREEELASYQSLDSLGKTQFIERLLITNVDNTKVEKKSLIVETVEVVEEVKSESIVEETESVKIDSLASEVPIDSPKTKGRPKKEKE